jgi:hypothetical protein
MRITFALIGLVLLGCWTTGASAQSMTRAEVLDECPDFDMAVACPVVADQFLLSLPSNQQSNEQIVDVAVAIADAARPEPVPLEVCLDAAEGIVVLAGGLTSDGRKAELISIAGVLCEREETAAIGLGLGGDGGDGGGGGGGEIIDPVTPPCVSPGSSDCAGNSEDSGGALNDAAVKP